MSLKFKYPKIQQKKTAPEITQNSNIANSPKTPTEDICSNSTSTNTSNANPDSSSCTKEVQAVFKPFQDISKKCCRLLNS